MDAKQTRGCGQLPSYTFDQCTFAVNMLETALVGLCPTNPPQHEGIAGSVLSSTAYKLLVARRPSQPLQGINVSKNVTYKYYVVWSYPGGGLYAGQDRSRPRHEQASHSVGDVRVRPHEVRSLLDVARRHAHLSEPEGCVQPNDHRPYLFPPPETQTEMGAREKGSDRGGVRQGFSVLTDCSQANVGPVIWVRLYVKTWFSPCVLEW